MKRYIAFLLLLSLVFGALFSCAKKESAENTAPDAFKDADFGGSEFTVLAIKHTETITDYYGGDFLDADTYTGDTVNDRVYERNLAVEERYSVRIKELVKVSNSPADVLRSHTLSDDICYDLIYGWGYKLFSAIPENYFANAYNVEELDFSKDFMCPSASADLEIGSALYVFPCDVSLNYLKWADMLYYNTTVADAVGITKTKGSPLTLVNEGKWTLDRYLELLSDASWDLDENGSTDFDEYFGLVCDSNDAYKSAHAAGLYYTEKNKNDISLFKDSEKLLEIINKVAPVYYDENVVKTAEKLILDGQYSGETSPGEHAVSYFTSNRALFCSSVGYTAEDIKAEKDTEYCILPLPKLSEEQEDYNATVSHLASMLAIPSKCRGDVKEASFERTGTVLSYLAYKSEEILLPEFIGEMLPENASKEARDALLTVSRSIRYELSDLISYPDASTVVGAMFDSPESAAAIYSRKEQILNKGLEKAYNAVLPTEGDKNE